MPPVCSSHGKLPQYVGQNDFRSTLQFSIEQFAVRNTDAEHFFETHGLSAQLNSVCIVLLRLTTFVFDGCNCPLVKRLRNASQHVRP